MCYVVHLVGEGQGEQFRLWKNNGQNQVEFAYNSVLRSNFRLKPSHLFMFFKFPLFQILIINFATARGFMPFIFFLCAWSMHLLQFLMILYCLFIRKIKNPPQIKEVKWLVYDNTRQNRYLTDSNRLHFYINIAPGHEQGSRFSHMQPAYLNNAVYNTNE